MSQSFPSSTGWEPYGSSQQQHALGWRRPATKPARPSPSNPTPSHIPAVARWNQSHRPRRTDGLSLTQPTASPVQEEKLSNSFQQHERESRVLERYNVVRGDIAEVEEKVVTLVEKVCNFTKDERKKQESVMDEVGKLEGVLSDVRKELEDLRAIAQDKDRKHTKEFKKLEVRLAESEERLQKTITDVLPKQVSKAVEKVLHRMMNVRHRELGNMMKDAIAEMKAEICNTVVQQLGRGRALSNPTQSTHQAKQIGDTQFTSSKEDSPLCKLPQAKRGAQVLSSNDVCAMEKASKELCHMRVPNVRNQDLNPYGKRVITRGRVITRPPSCSSEECDSLDPRRMYEQAVPIPRLIPTTKRQVDSEGTLFGNGEQSSESVVVKKNEMSADSLSMVESPSDESSWLTSHKRGKRGRKSIGKRGTGRKGRVREGNRKLHISRSVAQTVAPAIRVKVNRGRKRAHYIQ